MSTGKAATMASHLAAQTLIEFLHRYPERLGEFRELGKSGSRVTLKAKNLGQIERAYREAQEAGLPCATFEDSGHLHPPHFDGSPITVGVAIGPCTKDEARHITKRYQLVG